MNGSEKMRLRVHFENKWYLYVLALLLAFVLCGGAFYIATLPAKNEKLNIFVMAQETSSAVRTQLAEDLETNGIRSVEVKYGESGSMAYDMLSATYMPVTADILILDEKGLDDACGYLAELPERYRAMGETYAYNETTVAVEIGGTSLANWLDLGEKKFYAAFNGRSEKVTGEDAVACIAFDRLLELCAEVEDV